MKDGLVYFIIMLTIVNMGCSQQRSFLTEQERLWNPYKVGQRLVFGTKGGLVDTVEITKVLDNQFPDGVGSLQNERLRVFAKVKSGFSSKERREVIWLNIFSKSSEYFSRVDFGVTILGGAFWGKMVPFDELEEYQTIFVETKYGTYDDVIRLDDNSGRNLKGTDIKRIYWSKSAGYVKCETDDETIWELISIY